MADLLKYGNIVQWGNQYDDSAYHKLVEQGFCELDGASFKATAATPLALLTPKQFICAQQLARDCEIAFDYVPKAQKTHMAKLVENGWAMMDKHGSAWKATRRLIEAIGCWQKAKGRCAMNRKKVIRDFIAIRRAYIGSDSTLSKGVLKVIAWLVENGFAERIHQYVFSTNATPLALLTPACLKRAERLAAGRQKLCWIALSDRKYFETLEAEWLATLGGGEYHPTDKLIAAVKCWREANAGNQTVAPANENTMGDKTDDRGFLQIGDCSIKWASQDDLEICTRFGKKMRICGGDFEGILEALSDLRQVTE